MSRIIMGIDPGSNILGYAFLETPPSAGGKPLLLCMDVLDLRAEEHQPDKLRRIFESLTRLAAQYEPSTAAVEAPFYGKDAQAMLKLGRAQGVAIAALACAGIAVEEYSPRSVKKAVTGNGNASKEQVARMLPHLVLGNVDASFLDASDALGLAYCQYLQEQSPLGRGGKKHADWASFIKAQPERLLKP